MTTRRGRSSRRVSRAPKRRGFWVDNVITESLSDNSTGTEDLLETPSQFDKFGLTLVHTIVQLSIMPTTLFGAVGVNALDMGIAVIEQDAFAALALPDFNFPDDQPGRGWIYKERFIVQDHTTAGAVPTIQRVERRLKSKRKIDDMELLMIFSNFNISGTTFTVRVEGLIRQYFLR